MKILLIEDNPGDARLVQELLKEAMGHFTIQVAERFEQGLKLLQSQDIDTVLLDLNLPDSRGLETLTALQARFSRLPIVIMTSLGDEELANQAVRLGAQDFLVKGNVNGELLRRTLKAAIERKRAEEALRQAHAELELRVEERTKELTDLNDTLEQRVTGRTAELLAANETLRASRLASLNLMEDALAARRQAEDANSAIRDEIAERKKAEEALSQSEKKYRTVFNSMTESFTLCSVVYDANGKPADFLILDANPAALVMNGLAREDFVGKTWKELWPGAEGYWWDICNRVVLHGEDVRHENYAQVHGRWYEVHHFSAGKDLLATVSKDITERKKAEEVLRESEKRFRALTMASSDVVYRMSPDWSEMRQLSGRGFIADTENPSRNWLQEYIHPDDQPHVKAVIDEAVRTKSIFELEHRVLRVDGTLGWTFSLAIPLLDTKGEIVEWLGAASDITERKKAEETLRQLNRTLQALSRSDRALLYATEEAEYLQEICRIIVEDCGYAMVWVGFAEHDEAKSVRPAAAAGFEAGYLDTLQLTWADTERGRGPTGTAIRTGRVAMCRNMQTDPQFEPWRAEAIKRAYASSAAFPLLANGRAFGALTIYSREPEGFSDDEVKLLTELAGDFAYGITTLRLRAKHAAIEAALRESEERYRSLFKNMLHGFAHCKMLYDDDGRPLDFIYLDVNSAFEKLTGLKNVVGRRVTELIPGIREAHPELFDIYGRVASTGRPENVEIEFKPLGLWLSISVYSILREHFVAIFDDITERKKAETDIMKLSEDLAIRNMALESVNKELESFIYSVSHDLRAPIRTMSGFAKIINEDYAGKLDAQGQDYLNRILNGSGKATQLINDLLHLSKISRQEPDRIEVNLSNKALKVVEQLREMDQGRNVEVVVQEGLIASVDPRLIEIALSNLLGNAWKFTSKTENARIEFGACSLRNAPDLNFRGQAPCGMRNETTMDQVKRGKTVYFIRDNGSGFDMTYADKMFWPFHRLHTEKEFEGTGIGLTIVERIIHRHGGTVWAEGEVGKGATVFFTL